MLFLGLVFGSQLVPLFGAATTSTPINDVAVSLTMTLPPTASPGDREAAFAVLTANIAHYRSIFEQGPAIIDEAQHANDEKSPVVMGHLNFAAARLRYYRGPEPDMSFLDAFRQADQHFTADNEPQAIRDWVDDMSFMQDDSSRWVHVAVDYQSSQADVDAAAETVRQDLAKAQADARAVQQG
ncbi:MAG: hypothetical protein WCB57_17840 [Pseudonocardiaceae bacterium]